MEIEVTLFTQKDAEHLSLGKSLLKTITKEDGGSIVGEYDKIFEKLKERFGDKIRAVKIYVDRVEGVRKEFNLEIVPVIEVGVRASKGERRKLKRFSGRIKSDVIFKYIDRLINSN